jgi:hypothetical protein
MKYYIYILKHPTTNEVRYVGQTNNPKLRYNSHNSPSTYTHNENWIRGLKELKLKPIMEVIDECNEINVDETEIYWIAQFRAWGFSLTNLSEGGKSRKGYSPTKESIDKISKTLKDKYSKQEHHLKGKKQPEKQKKAKSEQMKLLKSPNLTFKGKKHTNSVTKQVNVFKEGILIDTCNSVLETSIKYDVNPGSISGICLKKKYYHSAKGYTFSYIPPSQ